MTRGQRAGGQRGGRLRKRGKTGWRRGTLRSHGKTGWRGSSRIRRIGAGAREARNRIVRVLVELVPDLPQVTKLTRRLGLVIARDGRHGRRPRWRWRWRSGRRGGQDRGVIRYGRQRKVLRPGLRCVPAAVVGCDRMGRQGQAATADDCAGEGDLGEVDRGYGALTMWSGHEFVLFSLLAVGPASSVVRFGRRSPGPGLLRR